jgi:hypothetical protein
LRFWALSIALRQILRKQDAGTIKTVDALGNLSVNFQFWGDVVSKQDLRSMIKLLHILYIF